MTQQLLDTARALLTQNILPFWMEQTPDTARGGFIGRIDGQGNPHPDAPKGAILHARILWSFAAAYRVLGDPQYLEQATRAKEYLLAHFVDREFGGVYWSLTAEGEPLETKKQIYAIGFAIYGLSEYARATGDRQAIEQAVELYRVIERHSFDPLHNGYFEAFDRMWGELGDVRLSAKDANERKTMNTHLHVLEPYTNLYRVWPSEELRERIANLLEVFLGRIYNPSTRHLGLFFDEQWHSRDAGYSYGHDIEASWLMLEAALAIGDDALTARVKAVAEELADATAEGITPDGSMVYERHADGAVDSERHWWVQAECVVGYLWLWHHHDRTEALTTAVEALRYIDAQLVDRQGGEWWWGILPDGTPDKANDKAGFWKCPYHNSRMCLEIIECLK